MHCLCTSRYLSSRISVELVLLPLLFSADYMVYAHRSSHFKVDKWDSDALEDFYGDSSDSEEDLEWGDPLTANRQAFGDLRRLHKVAMLPLFENSPMTSLEGNVFVLNIARANKHSNVSTSQLFAAFHQVLLPKPNTLADSEYEAAQQLKGLGLDYETIDVCPNNCVLYHGDLIHRGLCPKPLCRAMRLKRVGQSWVPEKVMRCFLLIPKITRTFQSKKQAAANTFHARVPRVDNLICHLSQMPHWAHVMDMFGHILRNPRCLRFILELDGFNPFSEKRSIHSTWAVMLKNGNLGP